MPIWLFDLDNTLHDASGAVFGRLNGSMTDYIAQHLAVPRDEADKLRLHYWRRYGATLLGLEKHHGIRAAHFLAQTHELPGLEATLRMPARDRAALRALPGRKFILTNAPADYAKRVVTALDLASCFEGIISIEGMRVFGDLRPKPDARMLKVVLARHRLPAHRCVLVEDTLANLKTARAAHVRTVWMQSYLKHNPHGPEAGHTCIAGRHGCVPESADCVRCMRLSSPSPDAMNDDDPTPVAAERVPRKRPKPGERRIQILQALAAMLEQPGVDRITTAALAAHLAVSEAALYRHFASKAQMFDGLIEFIEQSLFTLANQVVERETDPAVQVARILGLTLQFAEKNPGMARVMVGDALVFEHDRLAARMNQVFDRLESLLRQSYKALADARASQTPTVDAQASASLATSVLLGRLHRFTRTGFKRLPTEYLDASVRQLLA